MINAICCCAPPQSLQRYLHPSVAAQVPINSVCVCWKNSTVVVQHRPICKITLSDDGVFTIDFIPNWLIAGTFVNTAAVVEVSVKGLFDECGRPLE